MSKSLAPTKRKATMALVAAGFDRDSFGYSERCTTEREQATYPLHTPLLTIYPYRMDRDGKTVTYRMAIALHEAGLRVSVQQNHAEDPGRVQIDPRPRW